MLLARVKAIGNELLDLIHLVKHLDSVPSVGVFAWLEDPPAVLGECLLELLELRVL